MKKILELLFDYFFVPAEIGVVPIIKLHQNPPHIEAVIVAVGRPFIIPVTQEYADVMIKLVPNKHSMQIPIRYQIGRFSKKIWAELLV